MLERIETERFVLRPFRVDDLEVVASYMANPVTMQFLGGSKSQAEAEQWLKAQIDQQAEYGFGIWAVIDRADDSFVGEGGVQLLGGNELIAGHRLRFGLLPDARGKGYATEVAGAWLNHSFRELGLHEVRAIVLPPNTASARVLEKIGMNFVQVTEYCGESVALYQASP